MVVATTDSPVPDIVREGARNMVHTLSWVLGDCGDTTTAPYYILAGCCCLREKTFSDSIRDGELTEGHLELGCALGADLCLCPSREHMNQTQAPQVTE